MSCFDEPLDFFLRVDVRKTTTFSVPEVIGGRNFLTLVFKLSKAGKSTDSVQPLVALGDGRALRGPGDRRFRAHFDLMSLGGKSGEAGQEISAV